VTIGLKFHRFLTRHKVSKNDGSKMDFSVGVWAYVGEGNPPVPLTTRYSTRLFRLSPSSAVGVWAYVEPLCYSNQLFRLSRSSVKVWPVSRNVFTFRLCTIEEKILYLMCFTHIQRWNHENRKKYCRKIFLSRIFLIPKKKFTLKIKFFCSESSETYAEWIWATFIFFFGGDTMMDESRIVINDHGMFLAWRNN